MFAFDKFINRTVHTDNDNQTFIQILKKITKFSNLDFSSDDNDLSHSNISGQCEKFNESNKIIMVQMKVNRIRQFIMMITIINMFIVRCIKFTDSFSEISQTIFNNNKRVNRIIDFFLCLKK